MNRGEEKSMEKLKPCPLCGGEAEYEYQSGNFGYTPDTHIVKCKCCGLSLSMSNRYDNLKDAVIARWNRREEHDMGGFS